MDKPATRTIGFALGFSLAADAFNALMHWLSSATESREDYDAAAADRYEAMLGRNRPLEERRAEADRLALSAPIRKLSHRPE